MTKGVKDKSIFYINVALTVSVLFILVFIARSLFISSTKDVVAGLRQDNLPVASKSVPESVYDIDKVKKSIPAPANGNAQYSDLEEMYKNCDKTDVGGNMVEAWRRVKPEDKAKLSDGFDKQITISRETLKVNPDDKHAKNILYISEALKKMSGQGFNYSLKSKK